MDVLRDRWLPTIVSRPSPYCVVKLMIVHIACMGYLKLPLVEALEKNDFAIADEFKERPLFCKLDFKAGTLQVLSSLRDIHFLLKQPTDHMTGDLNDVFFDPVAERLRLPRWLIGWRSYRKVSTPKEP